jgi:hypothetical protein
MKISRKILIVMSIILTTFTSCVMDTAVINDPDGFTYVRERPSTKSKAKTKIRRNQIFLYTPIWGSDWCRAYSDDGSLFIGYIYRKRILPFDKCPVDIKKKMIKFMFD